MSQKWQQVKQWANNNKFKLVKFLLILIIDTAVGALLGAILAWGPLDANQTILVKIMAVFMGFTAGAMRLWQQLAYITGNMADKNWLKYVNRGKHVVIVGIIVLTLLQLYAIGLFPSFSNSYQSNFDHLWNAMDKHYPYFELKGIDWNNIYKKYGSEINKIDSDSQYHSIISQMLCELQDAHTGLIRPHPNSDYEWFGRVEEIEGKAVVTYVRPTINIPGLEKGSIILTRSGTEIKDYINRLDEVHVKGSSERQRRYKAYERILAVHRDNKLDISYLTPDEEKKFVTLKWQDEYRNKGNSNSTSPLITSRVLSSGFGVIKLPTFSRSSGHNLVEEFDTALAKIFNTPGIIIDLRHNTGGSTFISEPIAGRFLDKPFIYGTELRRHRLVLTGWARKLRYKASPRGKIYSGPVVLLTSVDNMSTAEQFIISMVDSGRAVAVGQRTSGASGNPTGFRLPGGKARFSLGDWRRNNGQPLEGVGIKPHVSVVQTVEDIRVGYDRYLSTAEDYLLQETR